MNNIAKMLDSIKDYFSTKRSNNSGNLERIVVFSFNGRLQVRKERMKTRWNIECSIGYDLGFRPEVVSFDCNSDLSLKQLESIGLHPIDKCISKGWKTNTFRIIPSKVRDPKVVERLGILISASVEEAKELRSSRGSNNKIADLNFGVNRLLPIHTSWMFSSWSAKDSYISYLVAKENTPTFENVFGWNPSVSYRAGKDLWKNASLSVKVRLKVIDTPEGYDDGNFFMVDDKLSDLPKSALYRGTVKNKDDYIYVKGEGHLVPRSTFSGSLGEYYSELPEDCHGMISKHNLKWIKDDVPEYINVVLGMVQDVKPVHSTSRKFSLGSHDICDFLPGEKFLDQDAHVEHIYKVLEDIKSFPKSLDELLENVADETDSPFLQDRLYRLSSGIGSVSDAKGALDSALNSMRSRNVKGMWLGAFARTDIEQGTIFVNHDLYNKIMENKVAKWNYDSHLAECTIMRFPYLSKDSFITMNIKVLDWIPEHVILCNANDAEKLQLDGDDHILIRAPYSANRGKTKGCSVSLRNITPAMEFPSEYDGNFIWRTYAIPSICQVSISTSHNANVKANSTGNVALADSLGGVNDIFANGLKKARDITHSSVTEPLTKAESISMRDVSGLSSIAIKSYLNRTDYSNKTIIPGGLTKLGFEEPSVHDMSNSIEMTDAIREYKPKTIVNNLINACGNENYSYASVKEGLDILHYHFEDDIAAGVEDITDSVKDYAFFAISCRYNLDVMMTSNKKIKDNQMSLFKGVIVSSGIALINASDPTPIGPRNFRFGKKALASIEKGNISVDYSCKYVGSCTYKKDNDSIVKLNPANMYNYMHGKSGLNHNADNADNYKHREQEWFAKPFEMICKSEESFSDLVVWHEEGHDIFTNKYRDSYINRTTAQEENVADRYAYNMMGLRGGLIRSTKHTMTDGTMFVIDADKNASINGKKVSIKKAVHHFNDLFANGIKTATIVPIVPQRVPVFNNTDTPICSKCGCKVHNNKVVNYSLNKYNKVLCYSCQHKPSSTSKEVSKQGTSNAELGNGNTEMNNKTKTKNVIAYVDGSHLGKNNKQGLPETLGFGIAINKDGKWLLCSHSQNTSKTIQYLTNKYGKISNPAMEMAGLLTVLKHFEGTNVNLTIRQDYTGAINYGDLWQYSEGSKHRADKPWKTKEVYMKQIVNQATSYAKSICDSGGSIKIEWVKGHNGDEGNEMADRAAKEGRTYNNLPLFK